MKKLTPTMRKVLHLLANGRDPYEGCKGNGIGARSNTLYALQNLNYVNATRTGWRITSDGRQATREAKK